MRLAVSGNGYATATNGFFNANRLAATTAHTLMESLEHSAAMAGHTAASFAETYDAAARQGVAALADLVDALANLGRMTDATRRNHAHAEARAVVGRRPAIEDAAPAPPYAHVALRPPPSAAGTRAAELPHWAAWVLDRVEGFVWPDSDTDRLRLTARAWRTAASDLHVVEADCNDAAYSLSTEVAPDVELAAGATRRLAAQIDGLATTFDSLASACDRLADEVHQHREQILDIVRDTLRDAVIVEGIGLVLGAVTGGITAAAATSLNGARIAAIAPRLIRIIDALRIAIGASETGARVAMESVIEARTGLRAFVDARILAASDRGCAGIPLLRSGIDAIRRGAPRDVPEAIDQKLGNYVQNLFKGTTNPDRVGDGTTMDAIRHERATGLMTHGRSHTVKGVQTLRGLERWLATRPEADPADIAIAKALVSDLKDALG